MAPLGIHPLGGRARASLGYRGTPGAVRPASGRRRFLRRKRVGHQERLINVGWACSDTRGDQGSDVLLPVWSARKGPGV